jgi:hypothetical protein
LPRIGVIKFRLARSTFCSQICFCKKVEATLWEPICRIALGFDNAALFIFLSAPEFCFVFIGSGGLNGILESLGAAVLCFVSFVAFGICAKHAALKHRGEEIMCMRQATTTPARRRHRNGNGVLKGKKTGPVIVYGVFLVD